ncbi:tRNA (adenosine(37)-N6)-threonylcarbamoyltransferase complex dimerization subunit type 1 TsaB [Petrocella sp. FN5]|uniref:tRNA (adenosine(37)-N6)-threonylcarbamoyltransferase complex dimerization subunit type 1 TsaB n=1 Tax=Petrocella sp. FN5 TaxID=3032002 RepID=UPI0023DCACFB|nr:tRNA (adenosine(37)-N6)-threonylcarbamoyltransferase complex dimerization subunit type 1 TsaB [Petrocella sp. FN5]MDF1615980.1 tRNA (adenosine(37)-N6)-threonylcarbamoyltransferase complex dimerization subunit type 1 TsaB [Petrocella sp. FN5]
MKVLAIESSAMVAGVAIIEDTKIIGEFILNNKKNHAQTIMPMLNSLKKQLNLDLSTLDAIAVSNGPGSYTGLRIGSATAKGLAHVLGVPIIGISTIESLAHNIQATDSIICPMLDARRQHVFSGAFAYEDNILRNIITIDQMGVLDMLEKISTYNKPILFLGDGFEAHESIIRSYLLEDRIRVARAIEFLPRASTLGFLAIEKYKKGEWEDYLTHQPNYYRLSQAEREYEEKMNGNS